MRGREGIAAEGSAEVDMDSELLGDGGRREEEVFWEEGVTVEDLGDGGFAGDASGAGRTEEALWVEGAAATTWELGGLSSRSEEERTSGRNGLTNFLCLVLGEG